MNLTDVVSMLTKCVTEESGPEGMLECLADLTGSIVVFEDMKSLTLSAFPARKGNAGPSLQYLSLKSSPGFKGAGPEPCRITDEYSGETIYRLTATVHDGRDHVGFLSLISDTAPFDEVMLSVLKIAADFFILQAVSDRRLARIELKLTGNFVEDLVFSSNPDHDSIINRAKALDYNITHPHRVLVAEFSDNKKAGGKWQDSGAEITKTTQAKLNQHGGGLFVHKGSELIILCRQKEGDGESGSVRLLAEEIAAEVSSLLKTKLFIGIGSVCETLEDYKNSYLAAKKALEIGEFMITEGQVRSFEQFKAHALFLSTIRPQELQKYAKGQLDKLLEYDRAHKTEFLKTLQEFLYLRNNIEGTAKSINMSVSGLKYRLKKIERIIGAELRDNKVSFDLQLALIILQLFGDYRI